MAPSPCSCWILIAQKYPQVDSLLVLNYTAISGEVQTRHNYNKSPIISSAALMQNRYALWTSERALKRIIALRLEDGWR